VLDDAVPAAVADPAGLIPFPCGGGSTPLYRRPGREVRTLPILAFLLRRLRERGARLLVNGGHVRPARWNVRLVVAVPAGRSFRCRLMVAARAAGFDDATIIAAPVEALAAQAKQFSANDELLILDLGGEIGHATCLKRSGMDWERTGPVARLPGVTRAE